MINAPAPSNPRPISAYGHLAVVYIVWGSTYFAVKICLTGPADITAIQLQAVRMACAALLLGAITLVASGSPGRLTWRDILLCAVTGVLMWVLGNGLLTYIAPYAASSFIVMAMGIIPLCAAGLQCLFTRTRPTGRVVFALLLGLAGLVCVMGPAVLARGEAVIVPGHEVLVLVCLLVAALTWALGTILQKPVSRRMNVGWSATFQMASAAVVLLGLATAQGHAVSGAPSAGQVTAFLFLVLMGSVLSLTSFVAVVKHFTPVVASTVAYVNPLVGMLLGSLALNEHISPVSLLGLAIVMTSLALVMRPARPVPGSVAPPRP